MGFGNARPRATHPGLPGAREASRTDPSSAPKGRLARDDTFSTPPAIPREMPWKKPQFLESGGMCTRDACTTTDPRPQQSHQSRLQGCGGDIAPSPQRSGGWVGIKNSELRIQNFQHPASRIRHPASSIQHRVGGWIAHGDGPDSVDGVFMSLEVSGTLRW